MRYTDIPLPQTVVHYCQVHGVKHIVISAGSRNAPLTNGFVENPFFKTYSIVDERAAGFFALGMAQQRKQAVALVCTSGSALLNYYPAVAEAYYSDLPLVVISADRMPHRIDIGDGQTINQKGVFEPHIEGFTTLKPDVSHATQTLLDSPRQQLLPKNVSPSQIHQIQAEIQAHNETELERVIQTALERRGPVHINVPMEEPLYGLTDTPFPFRTPSAKKDKDVTIDWAPYQKKWAAAQRKMILIGTHAPDPALNQWIDRLLTDPSVVVLTEVNSNIPNTKSIASIDTLLAPMEHDPTADFQKLQPDLLLTMGGMIVSKKVKAFLRKYPAKHHWHVDTKKAYDTYYHLSDELKTQPVKVLKALSTCTINSTSNYQSEILATYTRYKAKGTSYLAKQPFSDLKVFETLFSCLSGSLQLQLANSSPIRYAQLFSLSPQIAVFCNRGTSGIDGSTATAVGAAVACSSPTVLITGDLSFFYDINGLWNNYIPADFRIIIINNGGGGIFRILPGEKDTPKYDTYFETIHQRDAKALSKAFGFDYQQASSLWKLRWALKGFFKPSQRPKILEIKTPRTQNDVILQHYFKAMAAPNET